MTLRCFKVIGFLSIGVGFIAGVLAFIFIKPLYQWHQLLPTSLFSFFSVIIAVGLTFISISYTSGEWYLIFKRFRDLGIDDGKPDRKGQETSETSKWIDEIKKAKQRIIVSGVTLSGWFQVAWNDLLSWLPHILREVESFEIFLLDPRTEEFQMRDNDEHQGGEQASQTVSIRIQGVLANLKDLLSDQNFKQFFSDGKISIYLYKGTPLSLVLIDNRIYFTPYLPTIPNRNCPQLTLKSGHDFSNQIERALDRLRRHPSAKIANVAHIDQIIDDLKINQAAS